MVNLRDLIGLSDGFEASFSFKLGRRRMFVRMPLLDKFFVGFADVLKRCIL